MPGVPLRLLARAAADAVPDTQSRQQQRPAAASMALDIDIFLIAAQTLSFGVASS
jgi:hypothetical protein